MRHVLSSLACGRQFTPNEVGVCLLENLGEAAEAQEQGRIRGGEEHASFRQKFVGSSMSDEAGKWTRIAAQKGNEAGYQKRGDLPEKFLEDKTSKSAGEWSSIAAQRALYVYTRYGEEARRQAAEAYEQKVGRPVAGDEKSREKFPGNSMSDEAGKWSSIAAQKGNEAGYQTNPKYVQQIEEVKGAPRGGGSTRTRSNSWR
jgi:hypothetical protein